MDPLLDATARELLAAEHAALARLLDLLKQTDADPETIDQLAGLVDNLDELFLVVIVGEFNAGKSSVLNALFGEKVMEEGPIPTTAKIEILRYGTEASTRQLSEFLVERRYPSELLRHMNLVDTPGTNSIIQQHQKITEDFIPRSDLVLFVTSYDRPLTESERQFLSFIREAWGRRLVFILNKADLARDEAALRQVIDHIQRGCRELMDFEPRVVPVSAELAYEAKTHPDERDELWAASRFEALESFIEDTLAGDERIALKLTAPLETADRLLDGLETRLSERRRVLVEDEETIAQLETQVEETRAELRESYERHLTEVDNLLLQMERRGVQFLRDTIRASVSKIQLLRDRDRFKEKFAHQVIGDTDRRIEEAVTDAVDGLLNRTTKLQARMFNEFAQRVREAGRDRELSSESAFSYDRAEVFSATMREAERRIEAHDVRREAGRIIDNARDAANTFLGTGAGAAGLGIAGILLIIAPVLDVLGGLGLATGAALAIAGSTIIPRQRKKAIAEFKEHVEVLRTDVKTALAEQLDREVEASLEKVNDTIAPYVRFVEQEREVLEAAAEERKSLREEVDALRRQVEAEFGTAEL